jgi:hypothetical protein
MSKWSVLVAAWDAREASIVIDQFSFAVALVVSFLAVAALLETLEPLVANPLILWAPVLVAGAAIAALVKRRN